MGGSKGTAQWKFQDVHCVIRYLEKFEDVRGMIQEVSRSSAGGLVSQWDSSHRLGYRMCHVFRVLFWLKNKFFGSILHIKLSP